MGKRPEGQVISPEGMVFFYLLANRLVSVSHPLPAHRHEHPKWDFTCTAEAAGQIKEAALAVLGSEYGSGWWSLYSSHLSIHGSEEAIAAIPATKVPLEGKQRSELMKCPLLTGVGGTVRRLTRDANDRPYSIGVACRLLLNTTLFKVTPVMIRDFRDNIWRNWFGDRYDRHERCVDLLPGGVYQSRRVRRKRERESRDRHSS